MTISIQGEEGSYSHIAAEKLFGNKIKLLQRSTFPEVFEDMHLKKADYAVIPIENSTYGSIYQNFDLLTKNDLHIIKELYLTINFHLISFPGSKKEHITELYTHPVGMGQIKDYLEENPQIKAVEYPDTAGAVKMIKKKGIRNYAAAASRKAAEIYGMEVIEEKIQSNKKNYTRFFVLSRTQEYSKEADKTTIQFELGEEAGTLYKALHAFAKRGISLTKIESRPIIHTEWEYRFYIDILDGLESNKMKEALLELKKVVRHFRVLGSYKKGEYIQT